ncbi:hypothetical protein O181_037861 [Austropuccinia psidii MF-1]|uniref:Reverse transcriptase domain-containing protein n=1 Tax=Austropuccinia psidii MF-1 TaxID=1389203 RepID=A0A9Q3HB62_9BASI|nr:hypothetical protein [Austropuccinia psidii MF-1]
MDLPPSSYHDSLEELWDEEEELEEVETMIKVVPSTYQKYLYVFFKVKAEKPPTHRACDHHIELEGSLPPVGVIYSLSKQESDTIRAFISENVEKGSIWPSSSSTGAPVLFVKKKDVGLHLCVDYCKLNAVTRKNKYPVPPMNHLLNVFNFSSIFSKIDLCGAYNLLRIKECDEHLTCFRTKYGSFEYLVMPFGLTNSPASFQNLVNDIFQDILDVYFVVYLDDIMVFSKSEEEHVTHVSTVLSKLRANNLFAKASKCLFHVSSVEYLGYVVSSEGLKMDQEKVHSTAVSSRIIQRSSVHSPVSSRKIPVSPSMRKRSVSFTNSKRLSPPLQAFPTSILLYPPFRKRIPAELNYDINDKELLGIVWALKHWRAFLLLKFSPIIPLFSTLCLQKSLLAIKPAVLSSFLNSISQSLTALAA